MNDGNVRLSFMGEPKSSKNGIIVTPRRFQEPLARP